MSAQSLEGYNKEGTSGSAWRRAFAREEYALLSAAKRGIRLRSRSFANSPQTRSFA